MPSSTEYNKAYYQRNSEKLKAYQRARNTEWRVRAMHVGVAPDPVVAYAASHNGLCDICGDPPVTADRRTSNLHIDHDHETGEFRGLLCAACNHMLGNARDDTKRLEAAIQYLISRDGGIVPDLAFSGAGNINDSWTVQQLVNQTSPAANLGYDTKAPVEEPAAEEDTKEEETDGK